MPYQLIADKPGHAALLTYDAPPPYRRTRSASGVYSAQSSMDRSSGVSARIRPGRRTGGTLTFDSIVAVRKPKTRFPGGWARCMWGSSPKSANR